MVSESIVAMMMEYRKKRGYSQRAFADKLGISKNKVWRYENGYDIPTAVKDVETFAKLLGKTMAELVGIEETEEERRKRHFLDDVWDAHKAWFEE